MSFLTFKNISKTYGEGQGQVNALTDISFNVNKGELLAIMGPSGSGKSTLLNIIGCLENPSRGNYFIDNKLSNELKENELAKLRNEMFGFVVQFFALIEDLTIEKNISIPLEYSKKRYSKKEKKEKIENLAERLKIKEKLKRYPNELSGGQCQRAAIARALINDPHIILADEPTGALDKKTGEEVINIFKELANKGKTILIVTHDLNVAMKCDRVLILEDGKIKDERINDEKENNIINTNNRFTN